MNEFGIMEVVDEDESSKQNKDGIGDKENVCLTQNSSKTSSGIVNNTNVEKKGNLQIVCLDGHIRYKCLCITIMKYILFS